MLGSSLERIILDPKTPNYTARTLERIMRAGKSVRIRRDQSRRRELASTLPRKPELEHLLDPVRGFGLIPKGMIDRVPAAIAFAQQVLEKRRHERSDDGSDIFHDHILTPSHYEEAPPIFDLALSDDVLQIASEYLGEIPVLLRILISWSPVNSSMTGSQLYHRDGQFWFQRRAKFIFAANDIDETSGPFTFLPADISERVSKNFRTFKMPDRVEDNDMYRHASPADEIRFVGPAGSGLVLDSGRCFHFGSRTRGKERLMIFFQFWSPIDLQRNRGGNVSRSPAFEKRFGNDSIRTLLIPDGGNKGKSATVIMD